MEPNKEVIYRDSSLSAFITGLVVGGGLALLLATPQGKKIMEKIKDNLKDLKTDLANDDLASPLARLKRLNS